MNYLSNRLIIGTVLLWLGTNWIITPTSNLLAKTTPRLSLLRLEENIQEFTLKNGLKVIILERHTSPTVAVNIIFKVGSVNEQPGITGISHMLEHMLFKGTTSIGTKDYKREKPILERIDQIVNRLNELKVLKDQSPQDRPSVEEQEIKILEEELKSLIKTHHTYVVRNELNQIYRRHGARGLNAATSNICTYFYCRLPSNKLELWAWLESDRFSNPVWREFYQERDVVAEERRMRSEVSPGGVLWEEFQSLVYQAHPLGWPTIGWMSDIQSYTKEKLNHYFYQYYIPNNALAIIVGDVKPDEVRRLMRHYFESIPARLLPEPVTTLEPSQRGERRVEVEFDAEPELLIGYHTVKVGEKDDYVLDTLSTILSGGRTSRLYKNLVLDKKMCLSIYTSNSTGKYPGLFILSAKPQTPYTTSEVESAIYTELEHLKKEPVTEQELRKAKKSLAVSFLKGLDSNAGLVHMLGYYESVYSWRYILDIMERHQAVTAADITKAAQKYFVPSNRTVAILKPIREQTTED